MNSEHGFVRISAHSPRVAIGNPEKNANNTLLDVKNLFNADIVLYPELSMTGYTCGDLFGQENLVQEALVETKKLAGQVGKKMVVVGLPFVFESNLYNCAAVLNNGRIVGIIPKQYLPTYKEFYEKRWFQAGEGLPNSTVDIGYVVPFGPNLLFRYGDIKVGIEICEDVWMPIPPSCYHTIAGANIILNLSASNETVGKSDYRTDLVKNQSGRCVCAYAYASSGPMESTSDLVFGGHSLIAENSHILAESPRVGKGNKDSSSILADVDYQKLNHERRSSTSFGDSASCVTDHIEVPIELVDRKMEDYFSHLGKALRRSVPKHPFVPSEPKRLRDRCEDIFGIQAMGLVGRLTNIRGPINIGISGGLDSTLALLVAAKAFDHITQNRMRIHGVTMPGFGTTKKTKKNAKKLMKGLRITQEEIDIRPMCIQMFNDIGHRPFGIGKEGYTLTKDVLEEGLTNLEPGAQDLIFENVQARIRTSILMSKGFVLGTGDLSELALGWCTYNGDHMSMYNVNCSIPKTLVKFLVEYVANNDPDFIDVKDTLLKIVDTEISPELLPPGKDGEIAQSTEDKLGPYELHDFFLSHFIRNGSRPSKIYLLACQAFLGDYETEFIKKTLKTFFERFFNNQFKRNCVPDGPKVGSVSLSPRGDWRMPSDADVELWLKEVEEL